MSLSRRTALSLTLLGSAAFSLTPRRVLAALEGDTPLQPRLSAYRAEDGLHVSVLLDNLGKEPVLVRAPSVQLTLLHSALQSPRPIPVQGAGFQAGLLEPPSERELRSRAGPRVRWESLPVGESLLVQLSLPWPEDVPRTGEARLVATIQGTIGEQALLLSAEVPVPLAED